MVLWLPPQKQKNYIEKMQPSDSSNNAKKIDGQLQMDTKTPARSPNLPGSSQAGGHQPPDRPSDPRKRKRVKLILAILVVLGAIFGYRWWRYADTHKWTNDAYVTGRQFQLNSRINDTVSQVLVRDNQVVHQGQLLVALDPNDFQVQVQQAQASLDNARRSANAALANIALSSGNSQGQTTQAQGSLAAAAASVANAQAAVEKAKAAISTDQAQLIQAQADLRKTQADYIRYNTLYQQGVIAASQRDSYKASYEEDVAKQNAVEQQVRQDQAQLVAAEKQVANTQGQFLNSKGGLLTARATTQQTRAYRAQYEAALATVAQDEANLRNAQLQLSYTKITSPTDGRVGNAETVVVGQRVQPGQALIAIQQPNLWIVANFKETQLEWMRPGQLVEIRVDAFPHERFWGRVDSIAPASGSTTALLPPDNATGNFTKIVQRVPVKILFDPKSTKGYESLIVPGMSVEVTVEHP